MCNYGHINYVWARDFGLPAIRAPDHIGIVGYLDFGFLNYIIPFRLKSDAYCEKVTKNETTCRYSFFDLMEEF